MSSVNVDTHIPVPPGGHVRIQITIRDVGAMNEPGRQFILTLADKISAWMPPPASNRPAAPELPAVLRGVGGRP